MDPACVGSDSKLENWKIMFKNFLIQVSNEKKMQLLCDFVSSSAYECINDKYIIDVHIFLNFLSLNKK